MNVLVVGGTGFIGQYLCTELVDRGHDVTALARSPDEADLPATVATAAGDVTDYDSIEGAFEGQDAAINLVSLSPLFKPKGGDERHETVHLGGTRNCVRAAEEHGVERFVQMSALGADPEASTHFLRAKGRAEDVVRTSDLEWAIVRPSVVFGDGGEFTSFTKQLTTGFLAPLPAGGKTPFQPIWVRDLVPILADVTEDSAYSGGIYEIGGPEVLTLRDVTELVWRAEGKDPAVIGIPMSLVKIGLTLAGPVPFAPFGPDQARSLKINNTVAENDVTAFGVDPGELRTLADYLDVRA